MLGRDEYSNYLKAGGLDSLETEDTRDLYVRLTHVEPSKNEIVRTDGGPEWAGEFSTGLRTDGTLHEKSHPLKAQTNSGIERYIRINVEGTRVQFVQAGLDYVLWVFGWTTFARNFSIGTTNPKTGNAPWVDFRPDHGPPPLAVP